MHDVEKQLDELKSLLGESADEFETALGDVFDTDAEVSEIDSKRDTVSVTFSLPEKEAELSEKLEVSSADLLKMTVYFDPVDTQFET